MVEFSLDLLITERNKFKKWKDDEFEKSEINWSIIVTCEEKLEDLNKAIEILENV